MNLKDAQINWDRRGRNDPYWAILTDPRKKGNKWDSNEFFKIGINHAKLLIKYLDSLKHPIGTKKVLDFGCGAGRMSQALCKYFDSVTGVDLAPSMIELARKNNHFEKKCEYFVNNKGDLNLFPNNSFDFVFSTITFLHIDPKFTKKYLKEFLRILKPNGLILFDLPSKPKVTPLGLAYRFVPRNLLNCFRQLRDGSIAEICWVNKDEVLKIARNNGGKIIDIREIGHKDFFIYQYCFSKEK